MKHRFFYSGVLLICASVTMLQIIETRLLSVISHYYLAFLSISMAMFGITAGAVWVYYHRDRFSRDSLPHDLTLFAAAFSFSVAGSLLLLIGHAAVLVLSAAALVMWTELALLMAAPFFFAGVIVSLALTRSGLPVGKVYAADLVGGVARVSWRARRIGGAGRTFSDPLCRHRCVLGSGILCTIWRYPTAAAAHPCGTHQPPLGCYRGVLFRCCDRQRQHLSRNPAGRRQVGSGPAHGR
jgi:hypothetical protein